MWRRIFLWHFSYYGRMRKEEKNSYRGQKGSCQKKKKYLLQLNTSRNAETKRPRVVKRLQQRVSKINMYLFEPGYPLLELEVISMTRLRKRKLAKIYKSSCVPNGRMRLQPGSNYLEQTQSERIGCFLDYVDPHQMYLRHQTGNGGTYRRSHRECSSCTRKKELTTRIQKHEKVKWSLPHILLFLPISLSLGNQKKQNELWKIKR